MQEIFYMYDTLRRGETPIPRRWTQRGGEAGIGGEGGGWGL